MGDQERKPGASRLTRRGLLKAAGAGAAGAALGGLHGGSLNPKEAESIVLAQDEADEFEWDDEFDVVIVGSGGAASAAAVTAAEEGVSVVMLEKSEDWGGTTAHSGGGSWVPNNYKMREADIEDSLEATLRYCCRVCFPQHYDPNGENYGVPQLHFDRLEAFVNESADIFNWFEEIGAFQTAMDPEYPLYYGGIREAEDVPLAGQLLFPMDDDGNPGGGGEMIRQFRLALEERDVETRTEHRVERVVRNEDGRVLGVEATNADGDTVRIGARGGVVFGSGGFANNREMAFAYIRGPLFGGGAPASNQGDFVHIASSIGTTFGNMQHAWLAEAVLDDTIDADGRIPTISMVPGDSMIYVNRFGHRVMNEKMQYQDRTHAHFNWDPVRAEYTNSVLIQVYDERTATEFAGSLPIPAEGDAEHVVTGETLDELAHNLDRKLMELAGYTGNTRLDSDFVSNLRGTIETFNRFAEAGEDRHYLRGGTPIEVHNHLFSGGGVESGYPNVTMHPISDEGPYYAILIVASSFDTKGGPLTTANGQILDTNGEPIPGLYGAGNCIAQPVAQSYPGPGSTLGPTLTYGYFAGIAAAGEANGEAPEDDEDQDEDEESADDGEDTEEPDDGEEDDDQNGEDQPEEDDEDDASAGNGQTHVVEMTDQNVFDPEHLTISVGDTITWVTVGSIPHTATADPDEAIDPEAHVQLPDGAETWDSGILETDEEFSHTFTVPGEYTYFCIPHETVGMVGTITVEE